jgi:hypothetical protein
LLFPSAIVRVNPQPLPPSATVQFAPEPGPPLSTSSQISRTVDATLARLNARGNPGPWEQLDFDFREVAVSQHHLTGPDNGQGVLEDRSPNVVSLVDATPTPPNNPGGPPPDVFTQTEHGQENFNSIIAVLIG